MFTIILQSVIGSCKVPALSYALAAVIGASALINVRVYYLIHHYRSDVIINGDMNELIHYNVCDKIPNFFDKTEQKLLNA